MIFNTITSQEKVDFAKNLAVMLKSGIPINEALESLVNQTRSKAFRSIIARIKKEVETGTSLSEAFGKDQSVFGNVFISLLKAGEASGTLDENLAFLADWLERNNDLRKEISAAMLYPKIVLTATLFLAGGLAVFILPRLVPLFESLKVELSLVTRILMAVAVFVQKYWMVVLIVAIFAVIAVTLLNRIRGVRKMSHWFFIRAPFFGGLTVDYQLALVAQLFSTLFRSGLSLYESLAISSEAATNIHYQDSILRMKDRIAKGTTLSDAMRQYPAMYPSNFVSIVAIGEKSGTLDNSFSYIAEFYSKEVSNKTKKLPTVVEPLLLIFIGIIVGFVAISIILPIYQLTRGLQG